MPTQKPKKKPAGTKVPEWEDGYYETNEKKHTETLLKGMHLPAFDEEFDPGSLDNICLGLSFRLPKWERFLMEAAKRKCVRYKGFQ
jgi:hypothetical protein